MSDTAAAPRGPVLVTGGSGYIAGYIIQRLIADGWAVRASVRSLSREAEVRRTLGLEGEARLSFCAADLGADAGWSEAAAGCTHVMHVASPIPATLPKNDDELVIPARDGALRVLKAAKATGVSRVVMTSSTAAITYGMDPDRTAPFTEADWTDPTHPDTSPYVRSKTLAERAAWAWHAAEGGPMELVTINPGAVLGPVLGRDFSPSIEIVKKLLEGAFPAAPRLGFPLVDVRDLADLHVRALTAPGVSGERFLAAGDFYWFEDVATILKARLGDRARKVPAGRLPSWLMRLLSNFDPVAKSVVFELDKRRPVSSEKAKTRLGWTMRPPADTIVDTAESLIREKVV